jgi:hypothetical protein
MEPLSLYRRVLGPQFDLMPEVLRRFHDTKGGGRARGTLRVERGTGWLERALASLLRLPQAGTEVPVRLMVVAEGDKERWIRQFPGREVVSVQWEHGGKLMESFGPISFACALVTSGSCLRYDFQRAWLAGVPLPRRLAPFVEGSVQAGESGWRVVVRLFGPCLGEIIHYEGWVEPE